MRTTKQKEVHAPDVDIVADTIKAKMKKLTYKLRQHMHNA
jgi:hypothetical protein